MTTNFALLFKIAKFGNTVLPPSNCTSNCKQKQKQVFIFSLSIALELLSTPFLQSQSKSIFVSFSLENLFGVKDDNHSSNFHCIFLFPVV